EFTLALSGKCVVRSRISMRCDLAKPFRAQSSRSFQRSNRMKQIWPTRGQAVTFSSCHCVKASQHALRDLPVSPGPPGRPANLSMGNTWMKSAFSDAQDITRGNSERTGDQGPKGL